MKRCNSCGQILSQKITTCPACGSDMVNRIQYIDDYKIQTIIHEGRSSLVCKAVKGDGDKPVSIRLFTKKSGVDERISKRLEKELEELKKLPEDHFVQHYAIKKSNDGFWYRISEWVNAYDWGTIFMSNQFKHQRNIVTLFYNIASVLDLLHKKDHFMPYLILDDILIPKGKLDTLHVKINYKLSRFLNARATHHGPMLQKLLDCHPDIINQRAIDVKSGIWSLGKLFVELLTADPNLKDFSSKVDSLTGVDPELVVLIKIMLSDDPDLRPQSMGRVAASLLKILERLPYSDKKPSSNMAKPKLLKELQWFKKVVVSLIVIIIITLSTGIVSWFYFNPDKDKKEIASTQFIDAYADSVAFVLVEYGLYGNEKTIYKNKVEGTAFLVDKEGYFLTNRHVACPWLDDRSLFQFYSQALLMSIPVKFDYRIFLWFEGEKAFNRSPALSTSTEISDAYFLSSAHTSEGVANLRIMGVPRSSVNTGEMINSPFKNDFAVLKMDTPLIDMVPLPLELKLSSEDIPRLSPVFILGFPLGNKTQGDYINASITSGHVRRSTKEIIQVDSSIYKGNSGGPAINANGNVIGIASGVITDQSNGHIKTRTPLSDFGLILPIDRPAKLIASIKKGNPHWNGVLDFSLDAKINKITDLAIENKFEEAVSLSDTMLKESNDPVLIFAAGMLNFCTLDLEKSRHLFKKLALIEEENTTARLMLYIIDWLKKVETTPAIKKQLLNMNWYDDDEFLGYLAHVLKTGKRIQPNFLEYENRSEKSWRFFIEGLIAEQKNELDIAQKMFKSSILNSNVNDWIYFISFSRLNHIQNRRKPYLENKDSYLKDMEEFHEEAIQYRTTVKETNAKINTLIRMFESDRITTKDKIDIYTQLLALAPENRTITGRIAFFHAMNGEWQRSLEFIDLFFKTPSRETALSLSLSLLKGEILKILGKPDESILFLQDFIKTAKEPWYKLIGRQLLSNNKNEGNLLKLAGKQPEKLITMHTALGLWAEGDQDRKKASHHYREALSSYLDGWNEYDLALGRIMQFRETPD